MTGTVPVFQQGRPSAGLTSRYQGSLEPVSLLLCTRGCTPAHVEVRPRNVIRGGRPPLIESAGYVLLVAVGMAQRGSVHIVQSAPPD
jgi:hypothetical protein